MNIKASASATPTMESAAQSHYTRNILLQILTLALLLVGVAVWQWDVVQHIYLENQVNKIGWIVNGGIASLFLCGLTVLIRRFLEYRREEISIVNFLRNVSEGGDLTIDVAQNSMIAMRYRILQDLDERYATVNHNSLAATLLATESSRNSFLKFIHNVLILIGVFGTIVSLSFSLLGASDIIQSAGQSTSSESGFSNMLFGMSTALSTTMTAILAYLMFGYFYIKLTDTQTYLISRVEEVTATTLLPHFQRTPDTLVKDYSDSIRSAEKLIEQFAQSQQQYQSSVEALHNAATLLSAQLSAGEGEAKNLPVTNEQLTAMLTRLNEQNQQSATENKELLREMISLLKQGFRLSK